MTQHVVPESMNCSKATLADVLRSLDGAPGHLDETKMRDLRSSVFRIAKMLGDTPEHIALDLPAIAKNLEKVNPMALGMTWKTFSNIKSNFLLAVKISDLVPVQRCGKRHRIAPIWNVLLGADCSKRLRIGLSRLAHYASRENIAPHDVADEIINRFMADVRAGSLCRKQNQLHRTVTQSWNAVVKAFPERQLNSVIVPSFLKPSTRINWLYFPESLRNEVNLYLNWCKQSDEFSLDSRDRALAPASIVSVKEKVRAAANALVRNGVDPNVISSLKFLTAPESVLQILQWRKGHFGRENRQTFYIAAALVQIAREWVKADETTLTELKRLLSKIPHPAGDMTEKNKERLRQFDDPLVLHRLFSLPERMWVEVLADQNPNIRTLALAQTSITLALLPNVPLRPKNLASLEFDRHLFLRTKAGSISTLEIPGVEMKGHEPQSYDIPLYVAKMMITYRDKIAPMVIGHRPKYLFSNVDGTPKCQDTVAYLITTHLKRRAGIVLNPHAFRHLAGKLFLDSKPGGYETVRQLLGHKKMSTTVQFYTGQSTRRASRYHQQIIESSRPKVGSKSRPRTKKVL